MKKIRYLTGVNPTYTFGAFRMVIHHFPCLGQKTAVGGSCGSLLVGVKQLERPDFSGDDWLTGAYIVGNGWEWGCWDYY